MWRRVGAVVVWIALAVIATASIGTAAWMIHEANESEVAYKQFAQNSTAADAQRAQIDKQRGCAPLAPQARAKCEAEEYYSAHQAQHDNADLEAQRTTAVWTRYLGIAGIAGTAFGLLGVVLVLLTFADQRKVSRAELRAYVSVQLLNLYAFGTVYYEDAFGEKRETQFCYRAEGVVYPVREPKPGEKRRVSEMRWMLAPFYNESS